MIGWLRYQKTANFYKRRRSISTAAINEAFAEIRAGATAPAHDLFHHIKETLHGAKWSAICFLYQRDPSFLDSPPAQHRERVCGFLLLVEHRDHVVVFKSRLDLPAGFRTRYLARIADERIDVVVGPVGAAFEKVNLRAMAASTHALRSKTLEANDLQSVVSPLGGKRYVRRGYRVRVGTDRRSTIPNTGRITLRSEQVGHDELIAWSVAMIDALIDDVAEPAAFTRLFARSIDLASLSGTDPIQIGFDADGLTDDLYETDSPVRLVRIDGDVAEPLTVEETKDVLDALRATFEIRKVHGELRIIDPASNKGIGTIFVGKAAITLHGFDLPALDRIHVRPLELQPGEAGKKLSLKTYINQHDLLTVLFANTSVVYVNGALYRDEGLATGGGTLMKYVIGSPLLNNAIGEKGHFAAGQTEFDPDTLFRAIVDGIADGDEILVCDDLGDEWADFIGVHQGTQPKKISFYHAKHDKEVGLGASPLHIVVSQATKNLGRMVLSDADIAAKHGKWNAMYLGTAMSRIVRGNAATLANDFSTANMAPDTIRRVFIVESSLSRQELVDQFAAIAGGASPRPNFVQLYWLLMSFISAAIEVGAFPYVVCRE